MAIQPDRTGKTFMILGDNLPALVEFYGISCITSHSYLDRKYLELSHNPHMKWGEIHCYENMPQTKSAFIYVSRCIILQVRLRCQTWIRI
jgi:hypothetical protein